MGTKELIRADLKQAMKSGDNMVRDTLRMLDSAIKNEEIAKMKRETGLAEEEQISIVQRLIKQRKDSAEQYQKGGREDLAAKELAEVNVLAKYLPAQMSEDEVRVVVKKIISEAGAPSKSEMGKLMGVVMSQLKGKADGTLVRKIVESELSA